MTEHHDQGIKILAFVGLTGSGKSEAVNYVTEKGVPKVYFGGVILDAMTKAGLEHTQENEKPFREEIRRKEGNDFVVNHIISQIHDLIDAGQRRIIADGIYSWTEYKVLKREFPGELVVAAVVAPKNIRHHRLTTRPVRPLTIEEANLRDWAEIENIEKGGPIAIADYYIDNGSNIDLFHEKIDHLLDDIHFL